MTVHLMQNLWAITDAAIMFCKEILKKSRKSTPEKVHLLLLISLNYLI